MLLATLKNQSIPVTPHYLVKTKEAVEPNQPARAQLRYVVSSGSLFLLSSPSFIALARALVVMGVADKHPITCTHAAPPPRRGSINREERIPNLAEPEKSATTPSYHHFEELRLMHELKESVCEVVTPTWDDKCVLLPLP